MQNAHPRLRNRIVATSLPPLPSLAISFRDPTALPLSLASQLLRAVSILPRLTRIRLPICAQSARLRRGKKRGRERGGERERGILAAQIGSSWMI